MVATGRDARAHFASMATRTTCSVVSSSSGTSTGMSTRRTGARGLPAGTTTCCCMEQAGCTPRSRTSNGSSTAPHHTHAHAQCSTHRAETGGGNQPGRHVEAGKPPAPHPPGARTFEPCWGFRKNHWRRGGALSADGVGALVASRAQGVWCVARLGLVSAALPVAQGLLHPRSQSCRSFPVCVCCRAHVTGATPPHRRPSLTLPPLSRRFLSTGSLILDRLESARIRMRSWISLEPLVCGPAVCVRVLAPSLRHPD
jgi:hypothetical protein